MIKRVYHGWRLPDHIIFDNNCSVAKHLQAQNDHTFDSIGLAVDVFHFKSKHSVTDVFCRENCDPANFPELRGENGEGWYFNTSIAEQTNVWFGGYHSILREMGQDKYDFFLDEMILERNLHTIISLEQKGCAPAYW
jgi:hypothetical protein